MKKRKEEITPNSEEELLTKTDGTEESLQDTPPTEGQPLSEDSAKVESTEEPSQKEAVNLPSAATKGQSFLGWTKRWAKRWFIDAFSGMAQGLFVTLIAGTILGQVATWIGNENLFGKILFYISGIAKMLMGAGIGVGIAHALKSSKLVMFSAAVAGMVGAFSLQITNGNFTPSFAPGNPIGAYIGAIIAVEVAKLYAGKTKLDIILVPLGMMVVSIASIWIAWPFIKFVDLIGQGIALATEVQPFLMGLIISVIMGILLTMPTSSAAIWIAISASVGDSDAFLLAGGAAVVGCAAHMVGFAVASFRENKWSGLISQGIGTSMLQIPNIMRKPVIMVPAIVASAIVGPLATCVFGLRCDATGGGMGTSGLVGVFSTITTSVAAGVNPWLIGFGVALLMFVLPALISLGVSELMRKHKVIKFGDMKLAD